MYEDEDNDGRFPDESPVEVRYPRSKQEEQGDRERWPWLPGTIVEQCGPDEWYVYIEVRELAVLRDGRRAPRGIVSRNLICQPSNWLSCWLAMTGRVRATWPRQGG
jgi:hypothetical protein